MAARNGDFQALVAVLDPDVVVRADHGPEREIRGAHTVAGRALMFSRLAQFVQPVLVNGVAGILSWLPDGQAFSVMSFTVQGNKIVEIDVTRDPNRLGKLDLAAFS